MPTNPVWPVSTVPGFGHVCVNTVERRSRTSGSSSWQRRTVSHVINTPGCCQSVSCDLEEVVYQRLEQLMQYTVRKQGVSEEPGHDPTCMQKEVLTARDHWWRDAAKKPVKDLTDRPEWRKQRSPRQEQPWYEVRRKIIRYCRRGHIPISHDWWRCGDVD